MPSLVSRSEELDRLAQQLLVGGVNSPVRSFAAVGGTPILIERAEGAWITDVDGNRYVDLVGSWGPAIVGHAHPDVVRDVKKAVERGLSFGATCEAEIELAELILSALPSCEMIRFVNSGTEAVMSAIRLARAVTGRSKILKFEGCYHGHSDSLLVQAGSGASGQPASAGLPPELARMTLVAPYNDVEAVRAIMSEHGGDIAAILVEPVAGNMGLVMPDPGFLQSLRIMCDDHSTLLIFDEVMTGFRVTWGGYQCLPECDDAQPDITTLGKVIGGGMPVAAYAARREIMQHVSPLGTMYQAGTLSGNPVAMAAGLATLRLCQQPGFYETLAKASRSLADGLQRVANQENFVIQSSSIGGMLGMSFSKLPVRNFADVKECDHGAFARFFHAMLRQGVWLPPSPFEAMFVSAAHGESEVHQIINAAKESFREIGGG